jgi:maleate isomerase
MPVKLGVLVPSSNTALEPLTQAMVAQLAPAVSVHFSRLPVTEISLAPAALAQFDAAGPDSPVVAAARLLADARVDVIGWSGTSGGWLGFAQDEALCAAITRATGGVPATTSTLALNRALDALAAREAAEAQSGSGSNPGPGPKRFGLVTPYLDDVQARIVANYAAAGYEVAAESHLRRRVNLEFAEVDETTLGAQVAEVVVGAGAWGQRLLGVSTFCTNLSAAQHAERWEREHGIVLLDSVATVVWDMLRIVGLEPAKIKGWGKLFEL